jgi:threonyl-tRNA synthetase
MIKVYLENREDQTFAQGVTGSEIAQSLNIKDPIAILANQKLQDLCDPVIADTPIKVITYNDPEALEIIRHDAAHLLAQAIQKIHPQARIAIGPVTENGFYYDIDLATPITEADLPIITKEMHKLASKNQEIKKIALSRKEALKLFAHEQYKIEIISNLPEEEIITCYSQEDFTDLCKGPHGPNTSYIRHFKLLKVSGSYWKGDSKNKALQRIYGTAWTSEKDLKDYLQMLLEAEKRDHRKLGKVLDLFHFEEDMPGMVFWHPKGFAILDTLQKYIQKKQKLAGYQQVQTPILCSNKLWEKSGHIEKFKQDMFLLNEEEKSLKPMSCPCHIQIFNHSLKSYKDLPIRLAEFGACHRNEASGGLHGLMRVKSFTQDDGHIFCTLEQITEEIVEFCALLKSVYKDLGFDEISLKFADRPNVRAGSDETWNEAEASLLKALQNTDIKYTVSKGEGAFYGPKLEFHLKDAIGRSWQCGTLQLDFVLPERLDANYINQEGQKQRPVVIHRAILGTFERFIGMLIEHHKGCFPVWIAPIQVAIATVVSECSTYATSVCKQMQEVGIRTHLNTANDTISYKIRQLTLQKIPYILIIGKEEAKNQTLSVRTIDNKTNVFSLHDFLKEIKAQNAFS